MCAEPLDEHAAGSEPATPVRSGRRRHQATDPSVYLSLLAAAESCLAHSTYDQITVRKVAEIAGVDPSMINYYFNGKQGLFAGLIGFVFSQWRERLMEIEKTMARPGATPVKDLVQAIEVCFHRHRAIVGLISYEILQPASAVREAYLQQNASRSSSALRRFIEAGCRHGHFRRELNAQFTAFAVATLTIHPLAMGSGLEPAYGFDQEVLGSGAWRSFLEDMLQHMLGS